MSRLFEFLLKYIFPKIWMTRLAGWFANKQAGIFTKIVINLFIKYYRVNMREACKQDARGYSTFNEFFVRSLRDGVRLINADPNILVMPADGMISQLGYIEKDTIFQAKNHGFSISDLLTSNCSTADSFQNGLFVIIYLSPRDYHRVHMPCNGILREIIYVPGSLLPVSPFIVKNIPNLFSRNERMICIFDTKFGLIAQILIGATIVGSIETIWSGIVTPPREGITKSWSFPTQKNDHSIALLKGQEMGRFKLGSTVINLFMPNKVELIKSLEVFSVTKIGQPMAIASKVFNDI